MARQISAKASPFRAIATSGGRLKTVTIVDDAPTSEHSGSCIYTLSGVKVADSSTRTASVPTETISQFYEKIEWTHSRAASEDPGNIAFSQIKWEY